MSNFTETNSLDDLIKKAHNNGWIADTDKEFITALYNHAKLVNDNTYIDAILNIFSNSDVWGENTRADAIKQMSLPMENIRGRKVIPIEIYNMYNNNLVNHKISQKEQDAEYQKIYGKERVKSQHEIELDKLAEEARINNIKINYRNNKSKSKRAFYDRFSEIRGYRDFEINSKDMGWLYRVDSQTSKQNKNLQDDSSFLSDIYDLVMYSNDEKLFSLFDKILKTNINIQPNRSNLLNEIKATLKEIRNTDIGIGFSQQRIDRMINGLVPDVSKEILDQNYFKYLPIKNERIAKENEIKNKEYFINTLGENGWNIKDYNLKRTLNFLYTHYARLMSGKGTRYTNLGLIVDVYIENADKDGIYSAFIQKLIETKLNTNNKEAQCIELLNEAKNVLSDFGDEFGSIDEMKSIIDSQINSFQKQIDRQRDSQELKDELRNRFGSEKEKIRQTALQKADALRHKREQKVQARETAKIKKLQAEKDFVSPRVSLTQDLLTTYNEWKAITVANLTKIKNDLENALPPEDPEKFGEYDNFGKEYLDSIQNAINTLNDNSKTSAETVTALTGLYTAGKKQIETIGKVDNITANAPDHFKVDFAKSAKDMTKYSQNLLMDYASIKKWFDNTELQTKNNQKFSDASINDIGEKITSIKVVHNIEKVSVISNPKKLAKVVSKKSEPKMDILKKVESKYKVKCNVIFNENEKNIVAINNNPTVEQAAKHYILTKYVNDIMSINATISSDHFEQKKEALNSGALDKDIKNLAKNPVFMDLVQANPATYYEDMKRITNDANEMQAEYAKELEGIQNPNLGDYVLRGIKVESTARVLNQPLNIKRYMKESLRDMSKEDQLDQIYSRLGQVVLSQILSDPKNIHIVQGIAAGQYDVFEMKEKIFNYFKEKNTFDIDKSWANYDRLNDKLINGEIKKTVMDKVIKKIKPEKLVDKKAAEANANRGPAVGM